MTHAVDIAEPASPARTTTVARAPLPRHTVKFYEDDESLAATVAGFIDEGLRAGEPVLVFATPQRFERLRRRLEARGADVDDAIRSSLLVVLDAEQTLSKITRGGSLTRERFFQVVIPEIDRVVERSHATVRIYGEMVDLLCRRGNLAAALRLEGFWSDLPARYAVSVLCIYRMDQFQAPRGADAAVPTPEDHTHVEIAGSHDAPVDIDDARREILRLKQEARELRTELAYRRRREQELRRRKRELEELYENAPEGIHRVAANGTILWANKAELRLVGRSHDEYVGHHISEFHADADLLAAILVSLRNGEPLEEHEGQLRCKDGSTRHVVINSMLAEENGELIHTCFTRDITARKRAEDSLRFVAEAGVVLASSLDYESTLNTVCQMCVPRLADWASVELKTDGAIRRVAVAHSDRQKVASTEALWRRAPARLDDRRGVAHALCTGRPEIVNDLAGALLARPGANPAALDAVRELGLRSMASVPLLDGTEPIGALVLFMAESGRTFDPRDLPVAEDLARRASVAIQNARLYKGAQTATRLKDEFLATVSHELRTPLTAILGWARMLRAGSVRPDNVDRALDSIERNSIAQVQLVEDLLDVSRIISGKLRLDVQQLSLVPVVHAAIESMQQAIGAKEIQFSHVVDPNAGPIAGDPHRIQQVIWNLLSNAVKFTPRGGAVRLVVERAEGCVRLTVTDTGQGMAPEVRASIFERFKQADGAAARVHGGLGLGLAIVRHIVELHGGTVEAQSEGEGRGSAFVVELPMSPVCKEIVGPFRHRRADARPAIERPKELQGLTVLVVDDEADTRELLTEVLQQCGCSVLTAASAFDAFAVLDRASPQVAVCDIGMPGMDGYELIERIRQRPPEKGGRIVAVALTAFAGAEDRRRALRAGYQMHVAKPVEPAEFVAVLANLAQIAIAMS